VAQTKIVAFHSFRPGAGKTVLASNTAVLAAYEGWRVGLIDLDLDTPAAHFFLNTTPKRNNLNHYLWGNCTMAEACLSIPLEDARGALFLLPASDYPRDLMRAGRVAYHETLLHTAVQEFAELHQLDLIIIDLHAGLSTDMLTTMSFSDNFLLTLRLDEQDYQGSSIIVAIAEAFNVPLALVINSVPPAYPIAQVKTAVGEAYNHPVLAALPYSEDVALLSSRDVLARHTPSHPVVQLYRALLLDMVEPQGRKRVRSEK
jgi:septum site-determining protein MinD